MFERTRVKYGKNLTLRSRRRVCPVCGRMFDARSCKITVCNVCERNIKKHGRHLRREFT